MDATRINFDTATPLDAELRDHERDYAGSMARRWTALHEAANVVSALAGAAQEPRSHLVDDFPLAIRRAPPALRELAEQGVEDLAAIMEPGLAALIAVHSSGGNAGAPARALWQEFATARDTLLGLCLAAD